MCAIRCFHKQAHEMCVRIAVSGKPSERRLPNINFRGKNSDVFVNAISLNLDVNLKLDLLTVHMYR